MSSESPLPQAYKKAAEADSHADARPPRLKEAIAAHEEAANLFGIAEEQTEDDGAKRTLRAMKLQHAKASTELTRKLTALPSPPPPPAPSSSRSPSTTPTPTSKSRTHKPSSLSPLPNTAPPFALSPAATAGSSSWSTSSSTLGSRANPLVKAGLERARMQRQMEFLRLGSGTTSAEAGDSRSGHGSPSNPSSLYASSSSSSERTIDGSYTMLRPEKSDPFQRFWDVVEGMLQDHSSNPVAFASAPLGSVIDPRSGRHGSSPSTHRKARSSPGADSSSKPSSSPKKSSKHPSSALPPSNLGMVSSSNSGSSSVGGQDSFYIVPPSREPSGSHDASSSSSSSSTSPTTSTNPNPKPKTLEELTLENSSLRSSLDTLALHAQDLERKLMNQHPHLPVDSSSSQLDSTPRAFKSTPLPLPPPVFERGDRSVMLGGSVVDLRRLKKEAEKAWREEERVSKEAEVASSSAGVSPSSTSPAVPADQVKITNLESEVAHLKAQNEKQRDTIAKYKAQFEKIKTGARQRREAKASSAAGGGGEASSAAGPAAAS